MKVPSAQLDLRKGALVSCAGREYMVAQISDLDKLIAKDIETGRLEALPISLISPSVAGQGDVTEKPGRDLEGLSAEEIATAKERLEIIRPLLKCRQHGNAEAKAIAAKNGLHFSTLYRWRQDYQATGLLSSLLPRRPGGGKGKSRMTDDRAEALINQVIVDYYLTDSKPSIKATWDQLDELCRASNVKTPHINTLRKRLEWRDRRTVVAAREGERVASMRFDANEGSVGDAEWPLALVQMDHTELPVMIVDDANRRPINRPWVTFSIDVFSRVILGMYLSLDHPSAMSAGMCVSHSILPKEKWLAARGIEAEWPCWGVMGALHMDNAREFRGNMLKVACFEYSIDLHLRPVKKPHYGGHIERLMGTVSEGLKRVPGTTFSGPGEKGEYDSEGNAIMTLAELERWLTYFIAKYHHWIHTGIGMSPLQKYKEGLLGTKTKPGRGLPARRLDDEKVRIDFMPFEERTIQDYGVMWDLHYFSDVLRPWINAMDPENPKAKRKFRFRRDPRDISELYFFEPNVQRYYAIPYRDLSQPPISLWELREAKRVARKDGIRDVDDQVIFDYARKMREEVAQAAAKTKSARRKHQKAVEHAKARQKKKVEIPKVAATSKPAPPPAVMGYDPSAVTPFEDD